MSELHLEGQSEMAGGGTGGADGAVVAWAEAAGVAVREVVSWMGGAQSAEWYDGGAAAPLFGAAGGAVDVTSYISGLLTAVPSANVAAEAVGEARAVGGGRSVETGPMARIAKGAVVAGIVVVLAVGGMLMKNWHGRAGVADHGVARSAGPVGPAGPAVVSAPVVKMPVARAPVAVDAAWVRGAMVGAAGTVREWGRAVGAMAVVPKVSDGRVTHRAVAAVVGVPGVAPVGAAVLRRPGRVAVAARRVAAKVSRGLELSDLPVLPAPVARPYYGNADEGPAPVITREAAFMGLPETLGAPSDGAITAAGH